MQASVSSVCACLEFVLNALCTGLIMSTWLGDARKIDLRSRACPESVLYWICTALISLASLEENSAWLSRKKCFSHTVAFIPSQDTPWTIFVYITAQIDIQYGDERDGQCRKDMMIYMSFSLLKMQCLYTIKLPRRDVMRISPTVYAWNLFINNCALFLLYWLYSEEYAA